MELETIALIHCRYCGTPPIFESGWRGKVYVACVAPRCPVAPAFEADTMREAAAKWNAVASATRSG